MNTHKFKKKRTKEVSAGGTSTVPHTYCISRNFWDSPGYGDGDGCVRERARARTWECAQHGDSFGGNLNGLQSRAGQQRSHPYGKAVLMAS